jgi:hypothetical protein
MDFHSVPLLVTVRDVQTVKLKGFLMGMRLDSQMGWWRDLW